MKAIPTMAEQFDTNTDPDMAAEIAQREAEVKADAERLEKRHAALAAMKSQGPGMSPEDLRNLKRTFMEAVTLKGGAPERGDVSEFGGDEEPIDLGD